MLFTFLIVFLLWQTSYLVLGQTDSDGWSTPVNLSQSGTGTNPFVVMDSNNQLHVFWQDLVDDTYIYAVGSGNEWSQPVPVEVPFGTRAFSPGLPENAPTPRYDPYLVGDAVGLVHAFWIGDEAGLIYSRAEAETIADFETWTAPSVLGENVVRVEALAGANGRLHLAYITTGDSDETPAGLYYRRSDDNGESWSDPTALYQSPYFRLLTQADSNLNMSQDGQDVYISWDNRPRERVFFIHSQNNGISWDEPIIIDRRQEVDSRDSAGPANIRVSSQDGEVHLTWQAGHEGINCRQYHQWSEDGGVNWEPSQNKLNVSGNCPDDVQFLDGEAGLFLLTETETDSSLLVWEGNGWHEPILQPELMTSVDDDIFRTVRYTCGQTVFIDGEQLVAISCGVGAGQDVWLTNRSLTALMESLQVTSIWSTPVPLESSGDLISSPYLVDDQENNLHLFWQQTELTGSGSAIYYSRRDGTDWSRATAVLSSPGGKVSHFSVRFSPAGNFLAVWSSDTVGEIYFSRVGVDQAFTPSAWADPTALPIIRLAASAPRIVVDQDGLFHVIFAIPLNEDRGIYVVSSEDRGASWSEPIRIFDAVAAGWEMVDEPNLALTDDGGWHLLWQRRSLTGSDGAASLYYAASRDNGVSWTEPQQINSPSQQSAVILWHQIVGFGERTIHRSWQELHNGRTSLWHQQSQDGGLDWGDPNLVAESVDDSSAQMTIDLSGQVHLLQLDLNADITNMAQTGFLQHWMWQGASWQSQESLELDVPPVERLNNLAVAATGDGRLAVVYTGQSEGEILPESLVFVNRLLSISEPTVNSLPSVTPTAVATITPSPTATPEPTLEIVFPAEPGNAGPSLPIIGAISGSKIIIIGAILASIPVGLVFAFILFRRSRYSRY